MLCRRLSSRPFLHRDREASRSMHHRKCHLLGKVTPSKATPSRAATLSRAATHSRVATHSRAATPSRADTPR